MSCAEQRKRIAELESQLRLERASAQKDEGLMCAQDAGIEALAASVERLRTALRRLLPMARACKHEDFSDIAGNEDTRTAAINNALSALSADLPAEKPKHNTPEPPPRPVEGPAVWDIVIADMRERDRIGIRKYGQRLVAGDGRISLIDAYQELLDLVVYVKKELLERSAEPPAPAPTVESVEMICRHCGAIRSRTAPCPECTVLPASLPAPKAGQ